MRNIAITDIHGCVETFRALLEKEVQLTTRDTLYLLGDYVDRGPDSKGVLDLIMELRENGYQVNCLKGNHEEMMLNAAEDIRETEMWLYNGGQETLQSFGISEPKHIPQKYLDLLESMDYYYEVENFILVHAGLNFSGPESSEDEAGFLWQMHNPLTDYNSMLWIRWWYDDINRTWLDNRYIIHGHTPIDTEEIEEMGEAFEHDRVLDIDNGCFAKTRDGLGKLCAYDMTHHKLYFQVNID